MKRFLAWSVVSAPFVLVIGWVIYIETAWVLAGFPDDGWPGIPAIVTLIVLCVGLVSLAFMIAPEIWEWAMEEIEKEPEPKKENWP